MIRSFILVMSVALIASQAHAFDRMLRSDCRGTIEKLGELLAGFDERAQADVLEVLDIVRVTPQGWCQIPARDHGLEGAEFDTLEWRAEDINRWTRDGIPPLALQIRVTGMDPDDMNGGGPTNRPPLELDVTLRQDPDAGLVIVERAVLFNGAGDTLAVSGVFERVFLSSPSMMQVSMGSATFKAGLMVMTLEGTHENPFASSFNLEIDGNAQARGAGTFELIENAPDGVIDDVSRAELMAYAADLPDPVGKLEVSVASERGLGLMQVGMSMYSTFVSIMDDGAPSRELEILLDGLTIAANWTPATPIAD